MENWPWFSIFFIGSLVGIVPACQGNQEQAESESESLTSESEISSETYGSPAPIRISEEEFNGKPWVELKTEGTNPTDLKVYAGFDSPPAWEDGFSYPFGLKLSIPESYHAFLPGMTSTFGLPLVLGAQEAVGYEIVDLQFPKISKVKTDDEGACILEAEGPIGFITGMLKVSDASGIKESFPLSLRVQLCSDVCVMPVFYTMHIGTKSAPKTKDLFPSDIEVFYPEKFVHEECE